jgi:hypothetical protein
VKKKEKAAHRYEVERSEKDRIRGFKKLGEQRGKKI